MHHPPDAERAPINGDQVVEESLNPPPRVGIEIRRRPRKHLIQKGNVGRPEPERSCRQKGEGVNDEFPDDADTDFVTQRAQRDPARREKSPAVRVAKKDPRKQEKKGEKGRKRDIHGTTCSVG